ncbi:MAG: hypothetical protein JXJ22_11145 [Bacteroidales bacterium]|nr:hypothetical protein [Bacteroidales bacterium]
MNCKTTEKKLLFYLENNLPESLMPEVKEHLHNCSHCTHLLHQLERSMQIIENEKNNPVNPFFFTRVEQKLNESTIEKIKSPAFVRITVNSLVFAVVIVIGLFVGINLGVPSGEVLNTKANRNIQNLSESYYFSDIDLEYIESALASQE